MEPEKIPPTLSDPITFCVTKITPPAPANKAEAMKRQWVLEERFKRGSHVQMRTIAREYDERTAAGEVLIPEGIPPFPPINGA